MDDNFIIYGAAGVCRVAGSEKVRVSGRELNCLVLIPVTSPGDTVYLDTSNPRLTGKLRPLVSRDEIFSLIRKLRGVTLPWISDTRERKLNYIRILSSGDRLSQLAMIKSLYDKRSELTVRKKKLWAMDENALNDAQELIFTEFSVVLGIVPEEVPDFIVSVLSAGDTQAPADNPG